MIDLVELFTNYSLDLLNAFALTLKLSFLSFTLGFVGGITIATLNIFLPKYLRIIVRVFIEIIRGTPMTVQLFFVYYALPMFGTRLNPFASALIALSVNSSVYQSEYLRATVNSIPRTQWEAALSLGFTMFKSWLYIVIPQVLRIALPALTNELIYIIKFSSIAYFVTLPELVYVAEFIGSKTFAYVEVYVIVAFLYIVVAFIVSEIAECLYRRVGIPGLTISTT